MRLLNKIYFISVFFAVIITGCAGTKRLGEGEKLYTGAELKFSEKTRGDFKNVKRSLKELVVPEPNQTILGQRPRLWMYNLVGDVEKKKGIKHWLKTDIGEPPVLEEDVDIKSVTEQLEFRLENKGFFHGEVSPETKEKKKKFSIIYHVEPGDVYRINQVNYPDSTSYLNKIIASEKSNSYLKTGNRFDLEWMNRERQRLEDILLDSGYFKFRKTLLTYDVDTTVGDKKVDVFLRKKKGISSEVLRRYTIKEIDVIPGYPEEDSLGNPVKIEGISYFLDTDEIRARPVANAVRIRSGQYYSRENEEITLNRLAGMGVFRYININYDEDTSGRLKATIKLIPYKRKSIRLQLNAVSKTNNFVGPFFNLSFLNRNFMGGAEQFQINLNTGFETQIGSPQKKFVNSYEIGLNASLTVPRLIIPFHVNEKDSKYDYQTRYQIGGRSQRRVGFFNLISLDLMMGYIWNQKVIHRFHAYPVNINFLKLTETTQEFEDILEDNQLLANAYQEQFIPGGRYSYYYNSQSLDEQFEKTNNYYFNANLNVGGNFIHLIQRTLNTPSEAEDEQVYTLGGAAYAQFSKLDFDFRYYWKIDFRNRLATRLILGTGYAYGNSESLPYTHQFAVGGSSSLRAFRPRSVGPGEYIIPDSVIQNNSFIDQTADIKLEFNIEYRFDLYKNLKGAVFVDAGNIWTIRSEENRPGGEFLFNKFYKQIAVGTGFGIRYDINFLIIRLDLGMPLRIPYGPEDDRWVVDKIAIDKKSWRQDNLIWNIAIGYPF